MYSWVMGKCFWVYIAGHNSMLSPTIFNYQKITQNICRWVVVDSEVLIKLFAIILISKIRALAALLYRWWFILGNNID